MTSFWLPVLQGVTTSFISSVVIGFWVQHVTGRRHREQMAAEAQRHSDIVNQLKALRPPTAG